MSYSFSVTAETKDEAGKKVETEFEKVCGSQHVHGIDRQAAQDAAEAFVNLLGEPSPDEQISVSVSGWLSWSGTEVGEQGQMFGTPNIRSSSVTVNASLAPKA